MAFFTVLACILGAIFAYSLFFDTERKPPDGTSKYPPGPPRKPVGIRNALVTYDLLTSCVCGI
jgi:hypothetical protein